jgi:DNA repair protein RadD
MIVQPQRSARAREKKPQSRPAASLAALQWLTPALRQYQRDGIAAALDYLTAGGMAGLLVWPTGAGKSVALAEIAGHFVTTGRRVLVATHVTELVAQDAAACARALGSDLVGINCASLGRRDADRSVTVASVHSVYRRPDWLGPVDLVIVDEAHLLTYGDEGMYAQLLSNLRAHGPVPMLGLTATAYRMKSGRLIDPHDGRPPIFERVVHEASLRDLIAQGFLVRPIAKGTSTVLDTSGVDRSGGEFALAALERAVNVDVLNRAIVSEIIGRGTDRRSWLVFATGVNHAEALAAVLTENGITARAVHSNLTAAQRRAAIVGFRAGTIRALISMNVLSVGFDAPAVDLIAVCRPTLSPGLHVQMLGRGTRLSPETGKTDCLVLDFAGNVLRHGPLDLIDGAGLATEPGNGEAPVKRCPACQSLLPAGTRTCPDCAHEFEFAPRELKLAAEPIAAPVLSDDTEHVDPGCVWMAVSGMTVSQHEKPDRPPTLRLTFDVPGWPSGVSEFLAFDSPHQRARDYAACRWADLAGTEPPASTTEAMRRAGELNVPSHIRARPQQSAPRWLEIVAVRLPIAVAA